MAGVIFDRFHPCAVIDVGCGTGALLEAFRNLGCDVRGREYSDAGLAYCRRRDLLVEKFNIEKDCIANGEQYDLAVSFEVAEHLPSWSADRYVELLCGLAPLVVMSAATPGQGGHGHINEQSHAYWIEKFRERSYPMDEIASRTFRRNGMHPAWLLGIAITSWSLSAANWFATRVVSDSGSAIPW